MRELEADIRWHHEQIRLAKAALHESDCPENPSRELEVAVLTSSILRV